MADSYHTSIVELPSTGKLDALDKVLADEEEKGYELHSLTELTKSTGYGNSAYEEKLLVVTKRKAS